MLIKIVAKMTVHSLKSTDLQSSCYHLRFSARAAWPRSGLCQQEETAPAACDVYRTDSDESAPGKPEETPEGPTVVHSPVHVLAAPGLPELVAAARDTAARPSEAAPTLAVLSEFACVTR